MRNDFSQTKFQTFDLTPFKILLFFLAIFTAAFVAPPTNLLNSTVVATSQDDIPVISLVRTALYEKTGNF